MGLSEHQWRILGLIFRSRLGTSTEEQETEALLEGFRRADEDPGTVVSFSVEGESSHRALVLRESGQESRRFPLISSPSEEIVYRLISEAIDRERNRLILHAGCLATPTGSCLVIGPAGVGKTTLCLALWCEGMNILSDDITPISYESRLPEVLPRAFHLDNPMPASLAARLPPPRAGYPRLHYPFPGGREIRVREIDTILVLEREDPASDGLNPLSRAEAAHAVLEAAIKPRAFSYGRALETAMQLAAEAQSYRLRSSSVDSLRSQAHELLTAPNSPVVG